MKDSLTGQLNKNGTKKAEKTVIGIDVGGSTTKIVGMRYGKTGKPTVIEPQFVRATDALTSIYGAFGKFTVENGLSLADIDEVRMTGVGSSFVDKPIYGLPCRKVPEFTAVGLGALYLSGLPEVIAVSMGTGTAIIHAKIGENGPEVSYLGGTGVGGGTMIGLCRKMLGVDTVEHIEKLCEGGNLDNVDLRIKDISGDGAYQMNGNLTASNFGKLSDIAGKHDIALGVCNMVGETVAMLSYFAARQYGIRDVVLTGNLTTISPVREVFRGLENDFDVHFILPESAQFATVIGATLSDSTKEG